jgi:outer membrane murein-binding lipoprotein Lpp
VRRTSVGAVVGALLCALLASFGLAGCATSARIPQGITHAQRVAATNADLAMRWEQVEPGNPTYPRPVVPIVQYTNYLDAGPLQTACMHEAGYPHVVWTLGGGLVDTDVRPVDRFPVEVAIYVCEAKYPQDPLELGYLSDAQEEYLYSYWGQETVPCLRAHGAIVQNLPPVGEFGEGYENVGALNPFTHAKLPKGIAQPLLLVQCPPYPGQLYPNTPKS